MIIHSSTLDTMEKVIAIYGGTTWVKIEGRFLLGQSSSYAINVTGGESTHTLTTAEMPSHTHLTDNYLLALCQSGYGTWAPAFTATGNTSGTNATGIQRTYAGSSQAHNNMHPYKVVYIWERTE